MAASDEQALLLQMSASLTDLQRSWDRAIGITRDGAGKMVLRTKEAMAEIEKAYGSVDTKSFAAGLEKLAALQDKLAAAQAAGNAAEARDLRKQLVLQEAVNKAAAAQLETQLSIAKAAGSKAQVAQLSEALALQSQMSKLQGVGLTGAKALHEAEAAVVALSAAEKAAEGVNVGKALDSVFDRSRLAVLEEGSAKIPIFGSAIEALGGPGLAAAGALAAMAIAAEGARKSMEWADDLDRTSKQLGVTTTSLQQLDYASVATSIGLQQGREALGEFNGMIGKFEAHTGDAKLVKWAQNIKLTREEAVNATDPIEKLSLVMEKIAKSPDAQSRTAAAKAFGLDQLLPLINEGGEAIDKFIAKMNEAKANGSIVSAEQIAKAAELNDEVEELSHRISIDLKKAFIDLAPAIKAVAEMIERVAHAFADFTNNPTNMATLKFMGGFLKAGAEGGAIGGVKYALQHRQDVFDAQKVAGVDWSKFVSPTRGTTVSDPNAAKRLLALGGDKPKGSKSDQTDQFDKQAQADFDNALRATASAQAKLASTLQERANYEQAALVAERDAQLDKLAEQEKQIRKSKNDAHRDEQLALIAKTRTEVENKYLADTEALRRKTLADLITQEAQLRQAILANQTDAQQREEAHLSAMAGLAETTQQRTAFELQALAVSQQREQALAEARTAQAQAALAEAKATGDLAKIRLAQAQLEGAQAAQAGLAQSQADQRAAFARSNRTPLESFTARNSPLGVLQERNQADLVSELDGLANGLADAALNTHKFGQALSDVFGREAMNILTNTIRYLLANLVSQLPAQVAGSSGGGVGGFLGSIGKAVFGGVTSGLGSGLGLSPVDVASSSGISAVAAPDTAGLVATSSLIPHFATGGSFMVGGMGGIDRNLVQFYASQDERVTIETPAQQAAHGVRARGGGLTQIFNVTSPDADSFRRTQRQIMGKAKRGLGGV